jgi:hypothetical protein
MVTTYFVAVGTSESATLLDTGSGMRQLAKIEGILGFVPVVGMLLTFPNSEKPGKVFKVQSDTGVGSDDVRIVRVVKTTAKGPNIRIVN